MLGADHRMRRRADFDRAFAGRRAGTRTVLVALNQAPAEAAVVRERDGIREPDDAPALVGFVVGRAVGGAVQRNLVKRRLRHVMAEQISTLPRGSWVVVRAQPAAAQASYAQLGRDLASSLARVGGRTGAVR